MYPDRQKALELLADAVAANPGQWDGHSRVAGECAQRIGRRCGLDADKAYVLGLLHDIGRKFGYAHFGHVVRGYRYMCALGYDEVARICLTHSFCNQDINDYVGEIDVSPADLADMTCLLDGYVYDDYDRLIQLCDCLAGAEGVMDMTARMDDIARRYGQYSPQKRATNLRIKQYFEEMAKENIYRIVTDDTALWDR